MDDGDGVIRKEGQWGRRKWVVLEGGGALRCGARSWDRSIAKTKCGRERRRSEVPPLRVPLLGRLATQTRNLKRRGARVRERDDWRGGFGVLVEREDSDG